MKLTYRDLPFGLMNWNWMLRLMRWASSWVRAVSGSSCRLGFTCRLFLWQLGGILVLRR